MKRLVGVGASDGLAIGPARMLEPRLAVAERWVTQEAIAEELGRLGAAISSTDEQLAALSGQLETQQLPEGQALIEAHRLMLRSEHLIEGARSLIRIEGLAAEGAVRRVVDRVAAVFGRMKDAYLRERAGDVEAVGERLLRTLLGLPQPWSAGGPAGGGIGVGSTLSPIDAFHLRQAGLLGVVTEGGGRTSHAAIIVRGLELPYVLGIRDMCNHIQPGDTLLVDGTRGELIVNPDAHTLRRFERHRGRERARTAQLQSTRARTAVTRDGVRVELGANIETLEEVAHAVELGADSVGLFRTELLYLERGDLPSEEEQLRDAVATLTALGGRMATFRTLDLGGDKLPLSVQVPSGHNPSLGVRAIRFSFRRPDIFRTQLRALYRASALGPLRIMFPLISSLCELQQARRTCQEVQEELAAEGLPYDPRVPIGVMIETPSAALTADHLADSCDFLSVGTNDLIQYAFAADRENPDVSHLYQPLHPAILRLLKHAIDAAGQAGKPLSICGDVAGDPALTWVLLGLGARSLSMAPRHLPAVKSVILNTRLAEAQEVAARALRLRSQRDVEALVLPLMRERFPVELAVPGVDAALEPFAVEHSIS